MSSHHGAAAGRLDRRKFTPDQAVSGTGRSSNASGQRGMVPIQPSHVVANLFGDMGRDKKSKLQEKLRSQVSGKGRNASSNSSGGRPRTATRLTVKSVFNHYCRGYLPPGQTFDYIEKKTQVMDLKHFYDFMKDFGLFPGCFSSRQEVSQLFQKLNLMSKKKESRVELSRTQFNTFIQGVLDLKAPAHQRGMTSEDALNTWRRGKLSGDFSHWRPIRSSIDQDAQNLLDSIMEYDDVDDKEESIAPDNPNGNGSIDDDDDNESDIDSAVRQEIAIRNEQLRELLKLIWEESRLPSLPFLQESGISVASDPISISQLQLERDQIQECIDHVGTQLNTFPAEDIRDSGQRVMSLELQRSKSEVEIQDLIRCKYDSQTAIDNLIAKIEIIQESSRQMQDWNHEKIESLQKQQAVDRERIHQLQTTCSGLEQHLQLTVSQFTNSRQQYEDQIASITKELNSAMAALMNSHSTLETERRRSITLEEEIQIESSRRQSLSLQISNAVQQIGQDHEHLLQRQGSINEAIIQELRQTLTQETEQRRQDAESIRSLVEQIQKLEAESRQYASDYFKEKENNICLQGQLELTQNTLDQAQSYSRQQTREKNEIIEMHRQAEKTLAEAQQDRESLAQIKEQQESELQSRASTIAILQNEISSLQNEKKKDFDRIQDLSQQRSSIDAELRRLQSELQATLELHQKQSDLSQADNERYVHLENELDNAKSTISHLELELGRSVEHQKELQRHMHELQQQLSKEITETKFQIRKMLHEKQAELEVCRNEVQKTKEQFNQAVQVADEHQQNANEKLEIWGKTTAYLSSALEQSGERAERLHLVLQHEKQQTDHWRKQAIEQESLLSQIVNLAKARTLS